VTQNSVFKEEDFPVLACFFRLRSRASLLHPYLHLAHIELHHVNRLDQITVAEREVKALQAFLLVAMSQDGVGNVRINPATHRISVPSSAGGRGPSVWD